MQRLSEQIQTAFCVGNDLNPGQTALRTIPIYGVTPVIVRLASKRFLSKATAFDVVVVNMLDSIMSHGVDGSIPSLPTALSGRVPLGMHWLFGVLAFHTVWLGPIVKGQRLLLIKDGKIQEEAMQTGALQSVTTRRQYGCRLTNGT